MTIKTKCPNCTVAMTIKDELGGKTVNCPKCKKAFRIPLPGETASAAKPVKASQPEPDDDLGDWEDFDLTSDSSEDLDEFPMPRAAKKKTPKRSASADRAEDETPKQPREPAQKSATQWLVVGGGGLALLLVGLVGGYAMSGSNGQSSKPDTYNSQISNPQPGTVSNQTKAVPKISVDLKGAEGDLKKSITQMSKLLETQNDLEFLIQFAPIEELRKLQNAAASDDDAPPVPRDALKIAFQALAAGQTNVAPTGLTAQLVSSSTGGDPNWSPGTGYKGNVTEAIRAAIADLEKGDVRTFVRNMFPPDALQAMFRDGAGFASAAAATSDSALVVRMLADLKLLAASKPQVTGSVAEFTLAPVQYDQQQLPSIRPYGNNIATPDRTIRFSLINDHWRFYDGGALKQSGALNGKGIQLKFERIGSNWRLARYP